MKTLSFTEAVLAERALLALRDPAGELEAVAPMHPAQAEYHLWLNGGTLRKAGDYPRAMHTLASQARVERSSFTEYVVNGLFFEEDDVFTLEMDV
jgi:hypothetical protein